MTENQETRPAITPDMKVSELLDAYPELEDELIDIAPAFRKLRNPLLRKTVARLTSLRQAAQVGGVSLGQMMGRLRTTAGLEEACDDGAEVQTAGADDRPEWAVDERVVETLDARPSIEAGGHPLPQVMAALKGLEDGQVYVLITPFLPAPMLDAVAAKGFRSWSSREDAEQFRTYFSRS